MSKKKKPEQIQGKKYGARGLFNPLNSKGMNGIPPHIRYPESRLIKAVFSTERKTVDVPTICEEHSMVSYKDMSALTKKAFKTIDRLAWLLVQKEQQCERLAKHITEIRKKMEAENDL